jgi:hypothetical protein
VQRSARAGKRAGDIEASSCDDYYYFFVAARRRVEELL